MAVNYGLGGFKNGAAYGNMVGTSGEIAIAIAETWYQINIGTTLDPYLELTSDGNGEVTPTLAGYYFIKYSITTSGAIDDDLRMGIAINTDAPSAGIQSQNSKAGDEFTTNSSGIIEINDEDTFALWINNLTNTANITIDQWNVSIMRVGNLDNTKDWLAGTAFISTIFEGTTPDTTISYAAVDTFYPLDDVVSTIVNNQNLKLEGAKPNIYTIVMDGFYYLDVSISVSGSSNDDLTLGILKNGDTDAFALEAPQQKFNMKGGSIWQTGLNYISELKKGDTLRIALANNTDTTGTTKIKNLNVSLVRIGNL